MKALIRKPLARCEKLFDAYVEDLVRIAHTQGGLTKRFEFLPATKVMVVRAGKHLTPALVELAPNLYQMDMVELTKAYRGRTVAAILMYDECDEDQLIMVRRSLLTIGMHAPHSLALMVADKCRECKSGPRCTTEDTCPSEENSDGL